MNASDSDRDSDRVVVVGAGLAGLSCACALHAAGMPVLVVERGEEVGGRVRTDQREGFLLDHGFQVLQTAYPEAQRVLDYRALRLHAFEPGALIRTRGRLVRMADPWRRPASAFAALLNNIGTLGDRWKLARFRRLVTRSSPDALLAEPDSSTRDYLLNELQLSTDMVERFFRPWFSGVFLEPDLATSSRFFRFTFLMFAQGDASLPERGMGAIPRQLADQLPAGSLRLNREVKRVEASAVELADGERLAARALVVATEGPRAAELLGDQLPAPDSCSTVSFCFASDKPPIDEPILVLNGDGEGPINNLCVPSNVSRTYAPRGQSLVSVSVVGDPPRDDASLADEVRAQLKDWFGQAVQDWRLLKTWRIRHALPAQPSGSVDSAGREVRLPSGIFCCGDHRQAASIQGAMLSGRRAAEAVLAQITAD